MFAPLVDREPYFAAFSPVTEYTMLSSRFLLSVVLAVCVAALFTGCGGGAADPFPNRTTVSGTLTLDGQPVQWGAVLLTGQRNESSQEVATDQLTVRDGKFSTSPGARGTTPGENQAQVVIYAEEPKQVEDGDYSPKITGVWNGTINVEVGKPLTLELKSSDLTKSLN